MKKKSNHYLVVFYSRTGTTKQLGDEISKLLKCDKDEIFDTRNRNGMLGYLLSGRDATLKKLTKLKQIKKDPSKYDLVIIGTPVWAWNVSTPIRTYLSENKIKFKKVAFFCTQGGGGSKTAFNEMEKITGKRPIALLELTTKKVKNERYKEKLNQFVYALK